MRTETVIPGLPCRDLDDVLPFYDALGFELTYRQQRPNPFAAVRRGGIELHFFSVEGFDPADSMGTVVVLVEDTGALHRAFAAGLRELFGRVPLSGIPRMTRPRAKQGTSAGFSVVDPGGNWLRISAYGDDEGGAPARERLTRVVANAARQADAHGDEAAGVRVLENGLARHADAPATERVPALIFLIELLVRTDDRDGAAALLAEVAGMELSDAERDVLADDLAVAAELAARLRD
ncbi:bleomycin resistance protein [Pseudonocardia humida]|uniref:VOC family protein n=1 Tax=Pseudonocardia humida TaxID=2800819 RepID=A0ABT0ZT00_9PSEU|nr:VOC family protein [Pseudonocardia humida]MCO1653861.1 VOC family protein [Pseudonocardia humida]